MVDEAYIEHDGRVIETGNRFKHVMALALNPQNSNEGVLRCIVNRTGEVHIGGYIDESALFKVHGSNSEKFEIGRELKIKNEKEVVEKLTADEYKFVGLEDPDIYRDENGLIHLYFTLPLINRNPKKDSIISLGHAVGKSLDSLEMTMPVLTGKDINAKEVSIAPRNSHGVRFNLIESSDKINGVWYSVIRVAKATDMGKSWDYGKIVFHPHTAKIPWIAGHASPGPLFPKSFIDIGEGRLVGLINGREASKKVGKNTHYGKFRVGLCIYDYEKGEIDWVSDEPFIEDSEAKTITFASQFIETNSNEGIVYAHVDDSFVREYSVNSKLILQKLPANNI